MKTGSIPFAPASCLATLGFVVLLSGCSSKPPEHIHDHPRLTPNVRLQDVKFHSQALDRDMLYRVILPSTIPAGGKLPVVYLLHGGGGGFRDWTNFSDVARFAERGLILVMPEGESSYYVNAAERPKDRFEDYVTHDLISDVQNRFPADPDHHARAILGISMGGYGAVTLALKHPDLFAFAGGLSSALDVPSRPFSIKRIGQWRHHSSLFGAWGSETRRANDPYFLIRSADPAGTPYFFLTCGEQEGLLPANRRFATLLEQRRFRYEFHTKPGGHDWNQWNSWLEQVFDSMASQIRSDH